MDGFSPGLVSYFLILPDPRVLKRSRHKLIDILVIAVSAVICGARGWEDIEIWGNQREHWLSTFLELPNGIASHDTFARVFSILDSKAFEECFSSWARSMRRNLDGELIGIDGKTVRRSFDKATGKSAIHVVSAWMSERGISLGQEKVQDKSNEISAVPKLLDKLNIEGATITADAINTQTAIVAKIIERKADYVFCVKANQPTLYEEIKSLFSECEKKSFREVNHHYVETTDKGHGRIEIRKYWQTDELTSIQSKGNWKGLNSVGMVQSVRIIGQNQTQETRYFISSRLLEGENFSRAVRSHWSIENSLHWCLDVSLEEDSSRIRTKNAAENFCLLRKIALNLLKKEPVEKRSLKQKSKIASWNNEYLITVLLG